MQPEDFSSYCAEIRRLLKEKYADKITIRLGFEADFIPGVSVPKHENYSEFQPDYLIGSVHFIFQRDGLVAVDHKPEILQEGAKKFYNGDFRPLICDYFALQKEMLERGDFEILGHPDLVRKFNEKFPFFDENADWYKNELKEMAKAIKKWGGATEINTGAISRGWLSKPYPSEYFLSLLHENGVPIAITADAHSAENLDCAFPAALALAKKTAIPKSSATSIKPNTNSAKSKFSALSKDNTDPPPPDLFSPNADAGGYLFRFSSARLQSIHKKA